MRPPQPARANTKMNSRKEMIQCKDSIVILRRSEDRRRICIKLFTQIFDCPSLSFSSLRLLRSLRKSIRCAQHDGSSGGLCGPGENGRKRAKAVKTGGSGLRRFCFGDLGMERVCMFRKVSLYLHSNAIMGRCDTAFGLHCLCMAEIVLTAFFTYLSL